MTSKERHELRYQRRKLKREIKRKNFIQQFLDEQRCFGTLALIESAKKCRKGVHWKPSVQAYLANLVINSRMSSRLIFSGKWRTKGFHEFNIVERGKPRHIKSVVFSERCIQRSLCDNFITPILSHYLIYDNGATLKEKGTDFALNRVTEFLHKFYRKYGRNGYIFLFDFTHYFENINIDKLIEFVRHYIPDCLQRQMYEKFVSVFKKDGLGLGSQVSQISAVFFANALDHLIKDKLGIKTYERYMDDGLIICNSLEKLKEVIEQIEIMCKKLGIVLNKKKCQIIPLHKQFQFLKIRFFITETGKVVKRLTRKASTKERRKLKKFKEFVKQGIMTREKVDNMFHSWLYSQKRGKNYRIKENMIHFYNGLYDRYIPIKSNNRKQNHIYHDLRYLAKVA